MKISNEMQKELNEQINKELYSSYLYLALAVKLESMNFNGMATWMKMQSKEEIEHAMKLYNYIYERQGDVTLEKIDKPEAKIEAPEDAFAAAYKHEQFITESIHKLADKAAQLNDHATSSMLKWFVDEQVEEEANTEGILQQVKMASGSPGSMLMIDKKLGERKRQE